MIKLIFSKKAGLQMSINAIVVLVMAMVVLGLGLGFIRNTFGSAEEKFSGAIEAADLTTAPTATNPITFEAQTFKIKKGTTDFFVVAYFAESEHTVRMPSPDTIQCSDSSLNAACFSTPEMLFREGDAKGFRVLIDLTDDGSCSNAVTGKHICSVTIADKTKQFFLDVTA